LLVATGAALVVGSSYVDNGRGGYAGIGLGNSKFVVDGISESYKDTHFRTLNFGS